MKKLITALLFCIITFPAFAQFDSGYIERNWPAIASDTNRTYQEIVGICDSMFALVGYSDSAALDTTEIEEIDGSPYVLYRRWRNFWASRCDVETGKLHDFMADALTVLNNQNKTTTYVPGNCAGTSQNKKGLQIYGWVIMSNHLHMICNCRDGFDLSDTLRDFKKYTSTAIVNAIENNAGESRKDWLLWLLRQNGEIQFWQPGNHPEEIRSADFFRQKLNYIHQNPVRAGIVVKEEEYRYSSATDFYNGKGLLELSYYI